MTKVNCSTNEFHLGDAVLDDHLARKIDTALDLSCLRSGLAPPMGRPSIDPEEMIRMLIFHGAATITVRGKPGSFDR